MTRMFNPPHPGEVLKDGVFSDEKVGVTDAAEALGISRSALSRVLNCRAGISAELAVRLGKWLSTGPEIWLNLQTQYDLSLAEQALKAKIKKVSVLRQAA